MNDEHLTCMECKVYPCKCVAPPRGRVWRALKVDGAYFDVFAAVLAAVERQDVIPEQVEHISEFSLEQCIEDAGYAIREALWIRKREALGSRNSISGYDQRGGA